MFVERVEATGLVGLGPEPVVLGRVEALRAPWAVQRALRDALRVPFLVADPELFRALLADWGCEAVEVIGDPLVEGASWSGAPGLGALFARDGDGLVRVRVVIRLDPPQFANLRAAALREPRLVDALAGGATLELSVGLRFAPGFDAVGVDLLTVAVGGVSFAAAGPDRPIWLVPLLLALRGRLCASPLAPPRWGEAASAWSSPVQRRLAEALRELAEGPAELPGLMPLPGEPGLLDGERVVPLRFCAPEARAMVGWVGAARLSRPDVLVATGAPGSRAWQKWWRAQVEAADAPLEQVILLSAELGRDLGS